MWHAPLGSVFCLHVSPLQVLRTDKLIEELSPNSSSTIRTHNTEGLASCKETVPRKQDWVHSGCKSCLHFSSSFSIGLTGEEKNSSSAETLKKMKPVLLAFVFPFRPTVLTLLIQIQ